MHDSPGFYSKSFYFQQIPAVHDFGLFMSLIVANCWITVMLIMPPALYIWYISFGVCEANLLKAM